MIKSSETWQERQRVEGYFLYFEESKDLNERVNRLLTMLTVAKPTTTAMTQYRISRAIDTADGDMSTECLIFNGAKETACRTPTSERSMAVSAEDLSFLVVDDSHFPAIP